MIAEPDSLALAFHAHYPAVATMSDPHVELLTADERTTLLIDWTYTEEPDRVLLRAGMPARVTYDAVETSLTVQWRGELWPKFTVRLHGGASLSSVETLGNRFVLRLWGAA